MRRNTMRIMRHNFRFTSVAFLLLAASASADDKPAETRTEPSRIWNGNIDSVRDQKNLPATGQLPNIWGNQATTVFITNQQDLQKFWQSLRRADQTPAIDFTRDALIVTPQRATQLVIVETGGKAILAFSMARPVGKGQPYTIAVFPKAAVEAVMTGKR